MLKKHFTVTECNPARLRFPNMIAWKGVSCIPTDRSDWIWTLECVPKMRLFFYHARLERPKGYFKPVDPVWKDGQRTLILVYFHTQLFQMQWKKLEQTPRKLHKNAWKKSSLILFISLCSTPFLTIMFTSFSYFTAIPAVDGFKPTLIIHSAYVINSIQSTFALWFKWIKTCWEPNLPV